MLCNKSFSYLRLLVVFIILIYLTSNKIEKNIIRQEETSHRIENEIKILIWDPNPFPVFGGKWWWDYIFKRIITKQCWENRCKITYNREQYELADAVIFPVHTMILYNKIQVPKTHPVDQLWVLFSVEAYISYELKKRKALMSSVLAAGFNWTMHFRKDADVEMPYGELKEIDTEKNTKAYNNSDFWSRKDKKKMAVWMVSHCKTNSHREAYVAELSKYIHVDIYGKCGKLKCGCRQIEMSSNGPKCPMKECNDVVNSYFFDLAFTNNYCRDYTSERLWRSLQRDVVPVVMGGANYKLITPPHSVIDVIDFPTPKLLADYLKKLASDPVLYNKYFEWKSYHTVELGHPYSTMTCKLCEKLHQYRSNKGSVVTSRNISEWFDNDDCVTWQEALSKKFKHG